MSLEQNIMSDLKAAMKAKDQVALRTIRAVKAQILLAKTDGSGKELSEGDEIKMIQKMVKQRQESYDIFVKQGRDDLAVTEKEEIEVLKNYLPEQMDEASLTFFIQKLISDTGASGMKDMGKVMGMASQKLAGKADGKSISAVVKNLLTS